MEQNTDRMLWAVIALAVGGLLLFTIKEIFPDIVTSIGNYFSGLIKGAITKSGDLHVPFINFLR